MVASTYQEQGLFLVNDGKDENIFDAQKQQLSRAGITQTRVGAVRGPTQH